MNQHERSEFNIDKALEDCADAISDARIWCEENPRYTIRLDLHNKWGGVTVQGVLLTPGQKGEVLTYSTGQSLAKHVSKIMRRLRRHAETGSTWNPEEQE